jgi:hypothetical protein
LTRDAYDTEKERVIQVLKKYHMSKLAMLPTDAREDTETWVDTISLQSPSTPSDIGGHVLHRRLSIDYSDRSVSARYYDEGPSVAYSVLSAMSTAYETWASNGRIIAGVSMHDALLGAGAEETTFRRASDGSKQ